MNYHMSQLSLSRIVTFHILSFESNPKTFKNCMRSQSHQARSEQANPTRVPSATLISTGLNFVKLDHFNYQLFQAWVLLNKLFYTSGNAVFTPTRWTKVAPPMRYWACGLAIHNILGQAYLQSDTLQEVQDWNQDFKLHT